MQQLACGKMPQCLLKLGFENIGYGVLQWSRPERRDQSLRKLRLKTSYTCFKAAHIWHRRMLALIKELHRRKIIHRDLKPDNIVVNNGVYKLVDFGFSKQIEHLTEDIKHTCLGTITTMAPEVIQRQPYGLKVSMRLHRLISGR